MIFSHLQLLRISDKTLYISKAPDGWVSHKQNSLLLWIYIYLYLQMIFCWFPLSHLTGMSHEVLKIQLALMVLLPSRGLQDAFQPRVIGLMAIQILESQTLVRQDHVLRFRDGVKVLLQRLANLGCMASMDQIDGAFYQYIYIYIYIYKYTNYIGLKHVNKRIHI